MWGAGEKTFFLRPVCLFMIFCNFFCTLEVRKRDKPLKMLWVDKYRPKDLESVELYPEITETLRRLSCSKDIPHLLFYGPSGAGKKTRAMALLKAYFGEAALQVKLEHKSVQVSDSKTIDMATLTSPFHIDINPSDAGNYDRVIVMQMIREIAQTAPMINARGLDNGCSRSDTERSMPSGVNNFKVVILNEVDKMTRGAQQALRRTMEKYMSTCRLFLLCTSTSRLIPPLRSRCLAIRIPAHTEDNIAKVVSSICTKEGIAPLPSQTFVSRLAMRSDGNLRRAILMLEAAKMSKSDFSGSGEDIPVPDWKTYTHEIAMDIVAEQTPKRLLDIRNKFYELLGQCIPPDTILREMVTSLVFNLPLPLQQQVVQLAAHYDHNLKVGSKPIMHLEAFAAQVMRACKQHGLASSS